MKADALRGKTIQWTFVDGPMAKKGFEHSFHDDGTLEFRILDGKAKGSATHVKKYEVATIGADVLAASYLGPAGYTLTVVLDFRSGRIVGFASNERELMIQHGTFKEVEASNASVVLGHR